MCRKQSVYLSIVGAVMAALMVSGCATSGAGQPATPENPIEEAKVYENKDMNYIFDDGAKTLEDVSTEKDVLAALSANPALDVSSIGVICTNGIVTLRGGVDSNLERELAGRIAAKVAGVKEVRNLIQAQS